MEIQYSRRLAVGRALNRYTLALITIFSLFVLIGCSSSSSPREVLAELADENAPLSLELIGEQRSADRLQLQLQVVPRVPFEGKSAEIRVSATREGEVIGESRYHLASIETLSGLLEPRSIYPVQISVEAHDATDYQVQLLWGAEASTPPTQTGPQELKIHIVRSPQIRLEKVESQHQAQDLKLTAQILNISNDFIGQITFGVGIVRTEQLELDSEPPIPENEEKLVLERLRLAPGSSRELRLDLINPVPSGQESQYAVLLRVISIEAG